MALPFMYKQLQSKKYISLIATLLIMGSQDIVSFYNKFGHQAAGNCLVKYEYKLDGIKCEGCATRIKSALEKGYPNVAVDFTSKTISIWVENEAGFDLNYVSKSLFALDFTYRPIFTGRTLDCAAANELSP
ncbi:hypothetical protein HDV01_006667 [Terramyces sp. JEL0728]|nr:hypothetical protein HDV01_006667 [Terramyces sp. JEL0728]